jgi:alcohol dehydrogenase class IV
MTDNFCVDGIRHAAGSLLRAFKNGADSEARESMAWASLLGGLALANAGLGVVHGFAAPIGGMFHAPHGAVCAALLPAGMRANIHALRERDPQSGALERYRTIGRLVTGSLDATAEDGADWVENLAKQLEIPRLRDYGIRDRDVPELIEKAGRASSMKANPISLTSARLTWVVERSL